MSYRLLTWLIVMGRKVLIRGLAMNFGLHTAYRELYHECCRAPAMEYYLKSYFISESLSRLKINSIWMYNTKDTDECGNIFATSSNFISYWYLRLFYQYLSNNFETEKCTCATAKFVISTQNTNVFFSCADFCMFCITSTVYTLHTDHIIVETLSKLCQNIVKTLSKHCQNVVKMLSKCCQNIVKTMLISLNRLWVSATTNHQHDGSQCTMPT